MIAKFTSSPPWIVSPCRKFTAHDASIIEIIYMSKCQLLVTTSSDQTIKFWDPVSVAYDLTEPHEYPLAHAGGGKL
jgi:WD40 repeat protein